MTRLKSDSENLALRNRIKELEDKVDQLTVDVEEKTGMYVKKGGVVTIETTVSSTTACGCVFVRARFACLGMASEPTVRSGAWGQRPYVLDHPDYR